MRFSLAAALTAIAIGQAVGMSISHHNHAAAHKRHDETISKREPGHLHYAEVKQLQDSGVVSPGLNDCEDNGKVWIGDTGKYTNTFTNHAGEPIMLVVWGPEGSWVNTQQPLVTTPLQPGEAKTLSFADGASGAWAAIHKDTKHTDECNGQICDTWGEYTMNEWATVDVSREVNMNGHHMRIETPKCTTDMDKCVFVCPAGNDSCWQQYILQNCENGSQPGATYGEYYGAPSGGCGGFGGGAHLKTFFGKKH